jgi:hypothetical protein
MNDLALLLPLLFFVCYHLTNTMRLVDTRLYCTRYHGDLLGLSVYNMLNYGNAWEIGNVCT